MSLRKRNGVWHIRCRDENNRQREKKAYTDREASLALERRLKRTAARKREGLIDAFDEESRRPLKDHLDDYLATMEAAGRDSMYVRNTIAWIKLCLEGTGAELFSDLTPSTVTRYLGTLADAGLSPRTQNNYLSALRGFCNWAVSDRRIPSSPLAGMSKRNTETDQRRARRSLTLDELAKLIAAAERGPVIDTIDGRTRAMAYRLAAYAGLRRDEVGQLVRGDIDFESGLLIVRASVSKNRKRAELPMHQELAETLATYLEENPPAGATSPIVPIAGRATHQMMKRDLAAAEIPFEVDGRRVDFHALRVSFASNLARAGVSIQVARVLLRHSTIELTSKIYTRLDLFDLEGAMGKLEGLQPTSAHTVAEARSTGTIPIPSHTQPTFFGAEGKSAANPGNEEGVSDSTQPQEMAGIEGGLVMAGNAGQGGDESWGTRIRTRWNSLAVASPSH